MNIKWTDRIMNEELRRITHQKSIENQIKRRKQNWIGHTLCKETGAKEKTALDWNHQGYRRRGRPKRMWRRTIGDEIRSTRRSWNKVKETTMPGSSSWMLYAPQGVKGFDDDLLSTGPLLKFNCFSFTVVFQVYSRLM